MNPIKTICLTTFLAISLLPCNAQNNQNMVAETIDWKNQPEAYATAKMPSCEALSRFRMTIENIERKEAYVTRWNNDMVIIAHYFLTIQEEDMIGIASFVFYPEENRQARIAMISVSFSLSEKKNAGYAHSVLCRCG